jgi:hypothetical protein
MRLRSWIGWSPAAAASSLAPWNCIVGAEVAAPAGEASDVVVALLEQGGGEADKDDEAAPAQGEGEDERVACCSNADDEEYDADAATSALLAKLVAGRAVVTDILRPSRPLFLRVAIRYNQSINQSINQSMNQPTQ